MPRPLGRGILGASTIILSKDIDKYAICGSNLYETDVTSESKYLQTIYQDKISANERKSSSRSKLTI